jgi:ABC-type Fe3+-hydroxamate transport system substrate-binding protein
MRLAILAALILLSGCALFRKPAPPLPTEGPIAYSCRDGTQLYVEFKPNEARVAIIGGYTMVLPKTGASGEAPAYSNGRFSLNGGGAAATWQALNRAPTTCRGS